MNKVYTTNYFKSVQTLLSQMYPLTTSNIYCIYLVLTFTFRKFIESQLSIELNKGNVKKKKE